MQPPPTPTHTPKNPHAVDLVFENDLLSIMSFSWEMMVTVFVSRAYAISIQQEWSQRLE